MYLVPWRACAVGQEICIDYGEHYEWPTAPLTIVHRLERSLDEPNGVVVAERPAWVRATLVETLDEERIVLRLFKK